MTTRIPQHIEPGQVWSISQYASHRVEMRVDTIGESEIHGTILTSGRSFVVQRRTLSRGLRGAILVRNADGTEPYQAQGKPPRPSDTMAELRNASECVRTKPPRGRIVVSDKHRKIAALRAEGMSPREIAERFGIRPDSVSGIVTRVREADEDERSLRASNGSNVSTSDRQ